MVLCSGAVSTEGPGPRAQRVAATPDRISCSRAWRVVPTQAANSAASRPFGGPGLWPGSAAAPLPAPLLSYPTPRLPDHAPSQLWHAYLSERRLAVRGLRPDHVSFEALNNVFERALVSMHKMPRVWMDYLALLMEQRLVTRTRRTFDRALAALPITQHDRIWQLYLVRRRRSVGGRCTQSIL